MKSCLKILVGLVLFSSFAHASDAELVIPAIGEIKTLTLELQQTINTLSRSSHHVEKHKCHGDCDLDNEERYNSPTVISGFHQDIISLLVAIAAFDQKLHTTGIRSAELLFMSVHERAADLSQRLEDSGLTQRRNIESNRSGLLERIDLISSIYNNLGPCTEAQCQPIVIVEPTPCSTPTPTPCPPVVQKPAPVRARPTPRPTPDIYHGGDRG